MINGHISIKQNASYIRILTILFTIKLINENGGLNNIYLPSNSIQNEVFYKDLLDDSKIKKETHYE